MFYRWSDWDSGWMRVSGRQVVSKGDMLPSSYADIQTFFSDPSDRQVAWSGLFLSEMGRDSTWWMDASLTADTWAYGTIRLGSRSLSFAVKARFDATCATRWCRSGFVGTGYCRPCVPINCPAGKRLKPTLSLSQATTWFSEWICPSCADK